MRPAALELLTAMTGTRRIFLRGFAVACSIGIHEFEREAPQRMLIDVDLFLADAPQPEDRIDSVLDYDFLRREIAALAGSRHFNLQESLAESILAVCLAPAAVLAARVVTSKPDVYPDCEAVGLELFRAKPSSGWVPES